VEARVAGAIGEADVLRAVSALHERSGGCVDSARAVEDRLILWALISTGVFAESIGSPRMSDELESGTLATAQELAERVRTVVARVEARGHAGAVER
jgi:hypothetical protein